LPKRSGDELPSPCSSFFTTAKKTELVFKVSQEQDLALLLQLAQRLGIPFAQREARKQLAQPKSDTIRQQLENKIEKMRRASKDPLFWPTFVIYKAISVLLTKKTCN
jgi:hypothetical protein